MDLVTGGRNTEEETMSDVPMMHLGLCEDCLTTVALWPHPEREEPIPHRIDWESFGGCPVCDGSVSWDWVDPCSEYLKKGY